LITRLPKSVGSVISGIKSLPLVKMNEVSKHPKIHTDPAYDGLAVLLTKNPHLKNPIVARQMVRPPGNGLPEMLRALGSGKGKPTKAQIEKQKQEARLAELR
jgi:hypothetical protein